MITIKIDGNCEFTEDLLKSFPKETEKAASFALRRAEKGVITDLSRAIPKEYNITSGKVRKNINSRIDRKSFEVTITGSPLSLVNFTKTRVTKKRPAGGVPVRVRKMEKVVKGSFAAKLHNGQVHIFKRIGSLRLPILKLVSVSVPQMVTDSVKNEIFEGANTRFFSNFNHQIKRFLVI